eukprot:1149364-Pelagomonas_calceolata.AAC.2
MGGEGQEEGRKETDHLQDEKHQEQKQLESCQEGQQQEQQRALAGAGLEALDLLSSVTSIICSVINAAPQPYKLGMTRGMKTCYAWLYSDEASLAMKRVYSACCTSEAAQSEYMLSFIPLLVNEVSLHIPWALAHTFSICFGVCSSLAMKHTCTSLWLWHIPVAYSRASHSLR